MEQPLVTKDKYEQIMRELAQIELVEHKEQQDKNKRRAKSKIARKQRKVNRRK